MSFYRTLPINSDKKLQAYVIGLAIGDGNLSDPNGRAVRLRITCDKKYPKLIERIISSLKLLFPKNKVSVDIKNKLTCCNVSVYSNHLEKLLGWKAKEGPKEKQKVSIPKWIKKDVEYIKPCLRGLIETDGSIYKDRGYEMINFTTIIPSLAKDVSEMITTIGFTSNIQSSTNKNGRKKYCIRISKNTRLLKEVLSLSKN